METASNKVLNYLIVEDDEDHADIIRESICHGDQPQNVRHVASGMECLEYINGEGVFTDREAYPYPDVVLLDLRMPGTLDGLQTLQIIRADYHHRSLPVMILTASASDLDVNRAYELGANGYIVKSGDTGEMIEQLLWMRWSLGSLVKLPVHHFFAENGARREESMKDTENNAEGVNVLVRMILVSNEDTALHILISSYRENRGGFVELLDRLETLDAARFSSLVHQFCLRYCYLFAAAQEVYWDFLQRVVMEKLPKHLASEEMEKVVQAISAMLKDKAFKEEELPRLEQWQEFCRGYTPQTTTAN